jgi:hypothetical protein
MLSSRYFLTFDTNDRDNMNENEILGTQQLADESGLTEGKTRVGQSVQSEINHLRITSKSCGRSLTQLAKSVAPSIKGRVRSRKKKGNVLYTITAPPDDE